MNIPIIYEDDWLLIVDKPAGLLTIPTAKNRKRSLTGILNEDAGQRGLAYRLHPCHRLDRETSGLLIYAKGKSNQKKMMDEFRQRRVSKRYTAFVHGRLPALGGTLSFPIEGLRAQTRYKVMQARKDFSVVSVDPVTGRTNQIRIHFKHFGHPVVGESRFVFRRQFRLKAKRACLHAASLEFRHPVTAQRVAVHAELPVDMKNFLEKHQGQ